MRLAVQQCAKIDEAKQIKDQAAALAHYAKQRDDYEVAAWMSEIRLRAMTRIGELSRELGKAEQSKGGRHPTSGKPTKTEQLLDAGISTSAAQRYEELVAPSEGNQEIFIETLNSYCAKELAEKGM